MERYGVYSYCRCSPDWAVSLPGSGVAAAGPCFSVPASRLYIGRILWIAGMFECAVKRAVRSARRRASKIFTVVPVHAAVCKVICRFKL